MGMDQKGSGGAGVDKLEERAGGGDERILLREKERQLKVLSDRVKKLEQSIVPSENRQPNTAKNSSSSSSNNNNNNNNNNNIKIQQQQQQGLGWYHKGGQTSSETETRTATSSKQSTGRKGPLATVTATIVSASPRRTITESPRRAIAAVASPCKRDHSVCSLAGEQVADSPIPTGLAPMSDQLSWSLSPSIADPRGPTASSSPQWASHLSLEEARRSEIRPGGGRASSHLTAEEEARRSEGRPGGGGSLKVQIPRGAPGSVTPSKEWRGNGVLIPKQPFSPGGDDSWRRTSHGGRGEPMDRMRGSMIESLDESGVYADDSNPHVFTTSTGRRVIEA